MRLLRILALVGLVVGETGCGLPDQYFLQPPVGPATLASSLTDHFEFSNPDHSNDLNVTFQGFELYYKFYSDTSLINGNDYDATNVSDVVTQLIAKGFLHVQSALDSPPTSTEPLIPVALIERSTGFTVQVYINSPPGAGASARSTYAFVPLTVGVPEEIRRSVPDTNPANTGQYKTFLDNVDSPGNYSNDLDLGQQIFSNVGINGGIAYLAMYAVSFGRIGVSSPTRSAPVYLGYLSVQIYNSR